MLQVVVELGSKTATQTKQLRLPWSFLRDNCASNFHPTTLQRLSPMCSAKLNSSAKEIVPIRDGSALRIDWDTSTAPSLPATSEFTADWLLEHSLEPDDRADRRLRDLRRIKGLTAADFQAHMTDSPIDFAKLQHDETELHRLFQLVWDRGLAYVENVPTDVEAAGSQVAALADRTSWLRMTNYGSRFDVVSKPSPNNQAYTSAALPMHTDLPFYRSPPDIQMLRE
jgi:gamma-butyrobetaine dioxygenase